MKASVIVNRNFSIDKVDPRIYGGFIEHLGRAVYEGIYQPEHPSADEDGFRKDVINLVRELNMPLTRYPGGNFVSGYNWEDGVGPREKRPKRLDLAWKCLEPNLVGTDEFIKWCHKADTNPMMAVNLGTRGAAEAQALLEYCNHPSGSHWSDLRRENGAENPYGIKVWCLGNEMDGPWQTGHKTASEYGRVACEAAKMMRWTDPSIELVVCGSSHPGMPQFGAWEAEVLSHTYELVDYLSLHIYFANRQDQTPGFLARSDYMDRGIKQTVTACDFAGVCKKSDKKIMLSFDEWNVWYHSAGQEKKSEEWTAARPILEDIYNMEDALLTGSMLITLMNNADRVKIACLAQTVNVIAPIMTSKDGGAWRQTIYFPFLYSSKFGRGEALKQIVKSETYDADFENRKLKDIPYLTSSCIYNKEEAEIRFFAVNRSLDSAMDFEAEMQSLMPVSVIEHLTMHHSDLKASNSENNEHIKPTPLHGAEISGEKLRAVLPPASWNMIRVKLKAD